MKNLRRIWLALVILITVLFGCYRYMEIKKADSSGPVFTVEDKMIQASIEDGEDILLQGVTAVDKKDGDVTPSIIIENISKFYGDNLRTITYAAFDSDNHISKTQREVAYTDYTSPRFELNGSLRFRAGENVNITQIVSASDCLDGDLTNKVKIRLDSTINNRVTGFYRITYEVTNSAGDTAMLPINIEIYEPYNHEVELLLDRYLVYYTGEEIDYMSFLKGIRSGNLEYSFENGTEEENVGEDSEESAIITSDKIPKDRITIKPEVDTSTPGVYPVYYYYAKESANYTTEAKEVLYVVVE